MILNRIHVANANPDTSQILVPVGTVVLGTDGDCLLTLQEANVSPKNRKRWEYIRIHVVRHGEEVPSSSKYIGPVSNDKYVFLAETREGYDKDNGTFYYAPKAFHDGQ